MVVINKFNIKGLKINWPLLINIIGLAVSALFQSRAFMIGFLVAICFIWLLKNTDSYRNRIKNLFILIFTFIAIVFLFSYCFKQDSSAGRILIYKISWQMLKDHWIFGTGFGTFGHDYLNYQAGYFAKGQYTIKELLLADNTKHAFNDYLQWAIETGLPGIILLIAALLILVYLFRRAIRMYPGHPDLLITAVSVLIIILTAACFTHVFEYIYFQLTFVFSSCTLASYAFKKLKKQLAWVSIAFSFLLIWIRYGTFFVHYRSYQRFDNIKALYGTGYIQDALQNCIQSYPDLHHDVLFLSTYADMLTTTGNSNEAMQVLKELIKQDNSYFFHFRLADCYLEMKDLKDAEKEYITAVNTVPNRFLSRYKLFQFYSNTGNKVKALTIAYQILHLSVKIPSEEVRNIKNAVRSDLANRNWL